jgi:hypothetical protein
MKKGHVVVLVGVAGLLGGAVSNLLGSRTVAAQATGAAPAVIRTSRLELVDQMGKVRATLGVDETSGQTMLRFADPESGASALVLSVGPDARTITLTDPKGDKPALRLSVNPESKDIILYDKNGPVFGGEVQNGKLHMFGHEVRLLPCDNP